VLRHLAGLEAEDGWKPAPEYRGVALALIDAIWSINVRYRGVLNVIARYVAARVEQGADARLDTPEDLLALIESCGSAEAFADYAIWDEMSSRSNGNPCERTVDRAR
jgi:hypothetical protein